MNAIILLFATISLVNAAQCADGTYWDQEKKNCETCPANCATCWSATKCTSCKPGTGDQQYIIDSTYKCVLKVNVTNCETQDGNNCVECKDYFYLQGNNCYPCKDMGVENCQKCNMNKCFKCGVNQTEGSEKKQLTLYEQGGKQECIDCSASENDEKCGRCRLGQYFNTTNFKCEDCRSDCRRCTTADNCYLCKEDTALKDPANPLSPCEKIANCTDGHYYGNHCELCNDGYFVRDGYCVPCGKDCTRCVDETKCVECNQGATLNNTDNTCSKVDFCKRSSDLIGCLECESGYYLSNAKCLKCDESCATCKTEKHCFTCKANYYFTDKRNGVCSKMDEATCDVADQYGCLHCKSEIPYDKWKDFAEEKNGQGITNAIKQKAKEILGLDYTNDNVTAVSVGYYLPYTYNGNISKVIYNRECSRCAPGCRICEHNADWCTACNDNYQMIQNDTATDLYKSHFGNTTNTTIYSCQKLEATCKITTMGYCTECNDPNFLSGMECIKCHESCSSCVDKEYCQSCKQETGSDGKPVYWRPKALNDKETMAEKGKCMLWQNTSNLYYLDNCATYGSTGCQSCKDGFYRNANWGGCKKCPSKCVKCELSNATYESTFEEFQKDNSGDAKFADQFKCTECKAGKDDGSDAGEVLKDGVCSPCSQIENCIKCNGKDTRCDKCANNYDLQGDGTCKISDLVIAVPIASVVAVIIIIIIIIVIILIWRKIAKDRKEREKEIKPFKVSNELEMTLLSADNENFPLKTDTWDLDFGFKKDKAKIDEEYTQKVNIINKSKKSYFFEVLSGASHRYDLKADPQRATLKPDYAIEVTFTIKMLCTAVVKDEIGIVAMDMDEDSKETAKMTIKVESDLSLKLDHTELKLQMPAIGEGAFGMVFRGTYRGQNVAVKKMKARNLTEEQEKEFKHEVNMLTQYKHACVVNLIGAVYTEGEVSIVTEFADHGSLSKVWKKETISYDLKVKFMEDAVVALAYLHENSIIHRDVKGENVLVYSLNPHSPVCGKLTDFGTCRNISERALQTKELTTGIGTPTYMAPECLGNNKYDIRADVYSFGIVLYETYIERNAYDDDERFNQPWMIPQFVIEGKRLERPEGIPNDYWGLVEQCWQQEPDSRPSFPQVYATLAALDNVNIQHTDMNVKAEALDVGGAGNNNNQEEEEEEESSESSSSQSE